MSISGELVYTKIIIMFVFSPLPLNSHAQLLCTLLPVDLPVPLSDAEERKDLATTRSAEAAAVEALAESCFPALLTRAT